MNQSANLRILGNYDKCKNYKNFFEIFLKTHKMIKAFKNDDSILKYTSKLSTQSPHLSSNQRD